MKRSTTLPFFQVDSGQLLKDGMGRPLECIGLCFMVKAMYWENDCRLPSRERLAEAFGLKGKKLELLDKVLNDFFPNERDEALDLCKANALKTSQRNSANAKKRHSHGESSENLKGSDSDPANF